MPYEEQSCTQQAQVTSSSMQEESIMSKPEVVSIQHHLHQLDNALKIIKKAEAESDEAISRNDYIAMIDADQQKQQAGDLYMRSWEWLIERGNIIFDRNNQQHTLLIRNLPR